jgi:hypothetical protein
MTHAFYAATGRQIQTGMYCLRIRTKYWVSPDAYYSSEEVSVYLKMFIPRITLGTCFYSIGRCRYAATFAESVLRCSQDLDIDKLAIEFFTGITVPQSSAILRNLSPKLSENDMKHVIRRLDLGRSPLVIRPHGEELQALFENRVALLRNSKDGKVELFEPSFVASFLSEFETTWRTAIENEMEGQSRDQQKLGSLFELLVADLVSDYFSSARFGSDIIFFNDDLRTKYSELEFRLKVPYPSTPFFIEQLRDQDSISTLATLVEFLFHDKARSPFVLPGYFHSKIYFTRFIYYFFI